MGTWVGAIRTRLADAGEVRHAASLGGDVAEISSPAELGGETVSYTHLTLPTIYSV